MTESLLVDKVIQAGTEPQLESVCEKWKGCHRSDAGGQSPGRRKLVEEKPGRGLTQRHGRKSTAAQERKRGMKVTDGNGVEIGLERRQVQVMRKALDCRRKSTWH